MTAPTNVVISPGMNAGGTPAVANLTLGNSSYSYQVIACDKLGGCSAASPTATTTSGAATLGRVTTQIKQMLLYDNVMKVTTLTPHGFHTSALVYIQYFSTQTAAFEGWYIISGVPSPTSFTFLTSLDSRIGGTPTSDTSGGTALAFNCNKVTWSEVKGAWKYYIYGRDPGDASLIGVAEPGTTQWQDYGATMMGNFSFPSFVTKTTPSQPTNQYLLTTIATGGGTPTITLASPAQNSIDNISARMGSDAAIAAAFKAARFGTVYFPEGSFQVAGYMDLSAFGPIYVAQGGQLKVADTLQIPGSIYWKGVDPTYTTAFQPSPTTVIFGLPGSYPTVYEGDSGGELQFDHVTLTNSDANGGLLFYADTGTNFHFDYTTFAAGAGNHLGYMQRQFIIRTGGFDFNFSNCLFTADQEPNGNEYDIGYTFLPSALFAPNGAIGTGSGYFQHSWFLGKSAVEVNMSGSPYGEPYQEFDDTRTQNDLLPVYISSNFPSQNTTNRAVYFYGFSPADYPSAMTGNWAALTLSVGLQNLSNPPQGSRPLLVGNPSVFIGQQGGTASSGPPGGGWFATGGAQVGYLIPPPAAAPLLTNSSGGAVPVGNHTYEVAWTDAFGNSTTAGPSATINIVSGMQAVGITPPTAPPGAVGWQYYRDGALTGPSSTACGPFGLGTTQIDTLPFVACGNSVPLQNTAMSSGQGISGEETTTIVLTGGGHKTVIGGTFTADRTLTVPDVSGTIAVKIANGTVAMPSEAIGANTCSAVVQTVAQGVLPTDVVHSSPNSAPSTSAVGLKVMAWAATNSVSFQYCNWSNAGISPIPVTLNWQVIR
ncbi:MAG: hypothetical protein WA817_02700 [Candidatus Acidiferrum sp.]